MPEELSSQETVSYLRGQIEGLSTAYKVLLGHLANAELEAEIADALDDIAKHTLLIDAKGDLDSVPNDNRDSFYLGIRHSMEGIIKSLRKT